MPKKFLRTDYWRASRLGKNRKKLQKWRRARGKHSKLRRKRRGYPAIVEIGFKQNKKTSGRINGLFPIIVNNIKEMENAAKNAVIISSKVGAKKKLEMIKKAEAMKINVINLGKIKTAKEATK